MNERCLLPCLGHGPTSDARLILAMHKTGYFLAGLFAGGIRKRSLRGVRCTWRVHSILVLCLFIATPAIAASAPETSGVVLELSALGRSSDVLRPSEVEPDQVSTPGVLTSIAVPIRGSCAVVIGATVGGSWQTFDGPDIQGRLSLVEWTMRAGVERTILSTPRSHVSAQVFSEYGEQNFWVRNLLLSRKGPHGIHTGGGVRLGWEGGDWHRLRPRIALERSVYRAHGTDDESGNSFAWIGGSTSLSLGLGVRLSR